MRQPTPIKITKTVTADSTGSIGGGYNGQYPVVLYSISEAHEAWINRIAVSSPTGTPKTPITTGQCLLAGSMGEPIVWAPFTGTITAPIMFTEGRISAAHLMPCSSLQVTGDTLPANTVLRFDFQIVLVTGVSGDTPNINRLDTTNVF